MNPREASPRLHVILAVVALCVLAWSVVEPRDRFTWFLEMAPVPIAAALIAWAYPRWRFTPLALVLIAVHAVILLVGGKYTYAEVPLFNWLRDELRPRAQLLRPRRPLRAGLRAGDGGARDPAPPARARGAARGSSSS